MIFKDSPVLAENIINVTDVIGTVAVLLIVEGVAAKIAAELFIGSSGDGFTAFRTFTFFHTEI